LKDDRGIQYKRATYNSALPTDYRNVSSHESWGGLGSFGVRIDVSIDRELTKEEQDKISNIGYDLMKFLPFESAKQDPERQQKKKEIVEKTTVLFTGFAFFVEQVPNEYCSDACCVHVPWFVFTTALGKIKVGWRKRVIQIDWSKSNIFVTAAELFPNEDVTKESRMIHAWGYEKAKEYVDVLMNCRPEPKIGMTATTKGKVE